MDAEEIVGVYQIDVADVRWALAYENSNVLREQSQAGRRRFYVDADLLGLGHVLAGLRPDTTYPGDPGR